MLAKLENIRNVILDGEKFRDGCIINLTGDADVLSDVEEKVNNMVEKLPGSGGGAGGKQVDFYVEEHPWIAAARGKMGAPKNEGELSACLFFQHKTNSTNLTQRFLCAGFVVPTQVSYVGKGGQLYNKGEEVKGSASVVSRFLRSGYLWDHVRVIGGAYGGFCTFSPGSGIFSFLSYRDPNLETTLDTYDGAAEFLLKQAEEITEEQLTTAIIGMVGDLDGVMSPDQVGWVSLKRWMSGESAEVRQLWRDQVIGTKKEDFVEFAERLKDLESTDAVVSSAGAIEKAKEAGKKFENVETVF